MTKVTEAEFVRDSVHTYCSAFRSTIKMIEQSTAIDNEMTNAYILFSFRQRIIEPFITIEKETQYRHHHVLQSHHHVIHFIACLCSETWTVFRENPMNIQNNPVRAAIRLNIDLL